MFATSFFQHNTAQLYIGDLSLKTKESDIYSLFRSYGEVIMIKLVKPPPFSTHTCGFVWFKDQISASKARREVNGSVLLGSFIRVCRVSTGRDPSANIFIKNIPLAAKPKDLEDKFAAYGSVVSSKICCDRSGNSLGYGFLQFEKREWAREAIKTMNGTTWDGCVLIVSEFLPLTLRTRLSTSNLYIRGFPVSFSQDDIRAIFGSFGNVLSVGLMMSRTKDNDRAFGFVSFESTESAVKACQELHMKKTHEFEWYVVPHMKKSVRNALLRSQYLQKIEEWKTKNLYIKNIPKTICEKKLRGVCESFGQITSIKICQTENIKYNAEGEVFREYFSKGVGFVCFAKESEASTALKGLQDKTIEGQKLFIAMWKPRNELSRSIFAKMARKQQMAVAQTLMPTVAPMTMMQADARIPVNPAGIRGNNRFPVSVRNPGHENFPLKQPVMPNFQQFQMKKPAMPAIRSNFPYYSKETIGETLYPIVVKYSNELVAGKITGMMLEMELPMLNKLLHDQPTLREKVLEAVEVLRKAWQSAPDRLSILPAQQL